MMRLKNYKRYFSNNKLVDQSRTQLLSNLFISFFEGDYKNSIFDIMLELEELVRHYFKQCGLNIIKHDGSRDYIGLNNIFNDNKKNSFRDELLKTIDEDYYFTLKLFLNKLNVLFTIGRKLLNIYIKDIETYLYLNLLLPKIK